MEALDERFIRRTYLSTTVLAAVLLLYSVVVYGQMWLLLPVTVGVLLAFSLLAISQYAVPRIFVRPEKGFLLKKEEIVRRLRPLAAIVLVKYLSVGLLVAFLVKVWTIRELMAFCGGFILVQINITFRVIGRIVAVNYRNSSEKILRIGQR